MHVTFMYWQLVEVAPPSLLRSNLNFQKRGLDLPAARVCDDPSIFAILSTIPATVSYKSKLLNAIQVGVSFKSP